MTRRTPERAEFLADVLTTAVEGGINYWAGVSEYRWFSPSLDGGTAEPGPGGTANAYVTVFDKEGDEEGEHKVGLDDIARALGMLRKGEAKGWHPSRYKHVLAADRLNDAGDIDADDADCLLQLAAFGEVIYG